MRREVVHGALAALWERQQTSQHGWVLEGPEHLSQRQGVAVLERLGMAELAGREVRGELSAWEGRPIRWAARLTDPATTFWSTTARDQLRHAQSPGPVRHWWSCGRRRWTQRASS
jgi:hypothetical protein